MLWSVFDFGRLENALKFLLCYVFAFGRWSETKKCLNYQGEVRTLKNLEPQINL